MAIQLDTTLGSPVNTRLKIKVFVIAKVIGVCIDTNVIYQSVLEEKTYWLYVPQKM